MDDLLSVFAVAPHAGARIEMRKAHHYHKTTLVAPHAGARVEMHPDVAHQGKD